MVSEQWNYKPLWDYVNGRRHLFS